MAKHWTPHDFDAHSDPKIIKLLSNPKYGYKGYGWYWRIIEMMGAETKHYLTASHTESIAYELRESFEDIQEFICFCILHDLFQSDPPAFWSQRLLDEMDKYDSIIKQKSKAGKASAKARSKQKFNTRSTPVKQEIDTRSTNTIQHSTTEENTVKKLDSSQQAVEQFIKIDHMANSDFELKNGQVWTMGIELYETFLETYKTVSVDQEILKSRSWLVSNPSKRKTKAGMPKFLNAWLSRAKPEKSSEESLQKLYREMGI